MKYERRFLTQGEHASADRQVRVELRMDEDDQTARIRGHAAVFNSPTMVYGVREIVRPGAFRKTISEGDARGLFNHDPNFLLGRVSSRTLELAEDGVGLAYSIEAPKTDLIRDLVLEPLKRGDLSGSSFGFIVHRDAVRTNEEGVTTREIREAEVFDVGPVTFPAYEATDADFRSLLREARSVGEVEVLAAFRNRGLSDDAILAICERVSEIVAADGSREPDVAILHAAMRRRLQLAEAEA